MRSLLCYAPAAAFGISFAAGGIAAITLGSPEGAAICFTVAAFCLVAAAATWAYGYSPRRRPTPVIPFNTADLHRV